MRCQKTYKKRGLSTQKRRGQIKHRIDIEARPVQADKRGRIGYYEGDTVIGKGHKGVLITLVDRHISEAKIQVK